jgi:histidine triad (HIT) family protein
MSDLTIFQKIEKGEIPGKFEYEDDICFAIRDINPQTPTHILIIPRKPIPRLSEATAEDESIMGHLLFAAQKVAKQLGLEKGFRVIINNGKDAGETVPHMHVHLLGGKSMGEKLV